MTPNLNSPMTLSISPSDILQISAIAQSNPTQEKSPSVAPPTEAEMQQAVRTLLLGMGEDPAREGLRDTPKRGVKALVPPLAGKKTNLTSGYHQSLDELLNGAVFHENTNEMVLVREIDLFSSCEHHMLPSPAKGGQKKRTDGLMLPTSPMAK